MSNNAPIVVRASTLARLIDFTMQDQKRKFLAGVRIEPHDEGAIAVATNGASLGACFDRAGMCSAAITLLIEKRPLKGVLRGNVTDKHFAVIERTSETDATVKITHANNANAACEAPAIERLECDVIDDYVPDWRQAFRGELAQGNTLDRKLLKISMSALERGSENVTLRPLGEDRVFVRSESDDFAGIIRPTKKPGGDAERGAPDWLRA